MTIEEKQRALEFTFKPDNIEGDLKYDITYDDRNEVFPLRISSGGNGMDYPIALFVDVVEFLISKGVIEPKVLSKTVPATFACDEFPSIRTIISESSIPIPQVVKKDGTTVSALTSNTDPLASFDITVPLISADFSETLIPSTPELVKKMTGITPPLPKIIKSADGGIVMHSPPSVPAPAPDPDSVPVPVPVIGLTKKPPSQEMINRPVIRSRVTGTDPQSAEKEAALLRASQGKGAGKAIRSAHRPEGE